MRPAGVRAINLKSRWRRLGWAGWAIIFVGSAFVLNPMSQLWIGQLNDSDDYMRLARVLDLLNGQGWHDLHQPRLSPGDSFVLPWSRLVDVPLVLATLLLTPLIGLMPASGVAAFLVPLLWLFAFCCIVPLLGRGILPNKRGWVLVVLTFGNLCILRELRPLRIDHHGVQLLFALIGLVTLRFYLLQPHWRWRALTGLIAACGLAVGAESFLWLTLAAVYIALDAAWRGMTVRRDAQAFSAALLVGLLVLLPIVRPPADWLAHDMALPGLPHLLLASIMLGTFMILQRYGGGRWRALLLLCGMGSVGSVTLLVLVPELRAGIYGGTMGADNQKIILGSVLEAKSFVARMAAFSWTHADIVRFWPLVAHNIMLPLLGLLSLSVTITMALRHRALRQQQLWLLQAWFLLPTLALALFWQSRVIYYAALFALPSLAWMTVTIGRWGAQKLPVPYLRWSALGVVLALPAVMIASADIVQGARPVQALLYPSWFVASPCDFRALADALNEKKLFGEQPINVIGSMTGGAELLYRTPHRVFSAPYDVSGNALARQFFGNRDLGAAYQLARMHQIGAVFMCDGYAKAFLPDAGAEQAAAAAGVLLAQSQPVPPEIAADRVLIDYVMQGDGPDWLEPIPLPQPNLRLYRVHLPPPP